jgi:lambda family phage portal protein
MSKRESRKALEIKPNLADKVIGYFAPKVALRNIQARAVMALASGGGNGTGYTGASRTRASTSNWGAQAGSAEADISPDLTLNRARSRDLVRNNPIAGGAVGQMVTNVIGTGLSLSPKPDSDFLGLSEEQADEWALSTLREYSLWANSKDCDLRRVLNFYQLQELVFRSRFESGDVFVNTPLKKRGNPYDLTLQVIEADRCNNPNRAQNTDTIIDGVELDADGAAVKYHFSERHPGDMRKTNNKWAALDAFDKNGRRRVFHLFKQIRPEQVRGVPEFAPIIEPLKQLGRFTEAELQAAVVNGMFAMFVRMDHEAFMDIFDDTGRKNYAENAGQWDGNLDSNGRVINLLPGEEPVAPNPGRPNSEFDPFVQSIMRQIGMQLEVPYEVLIMHFQSSYSAARAALLAAWKTYRRWRDWMASDFCQPVYELWLEEAVAKGRIKAPGFFASPLTRAAWSKSIWIGDGPGSIDPSKEADAAEKRIELGTSTRETESILHDGVDYKTKHKQLAKEKRMRDKDGLTALPSNGGVPVNVTYPSDDAEETKNNPKSDE